MALAALFTLFTKSYFIQGDHPLVTSSLLCHANPLAPSSLRPNAAITVVSLRWRGAFAVLLCAIFTIDATAPLSMTFTH